MSQPYRPPPGPASLTGWGLLAVWAAMTLAALWFVLRFGHNLPWGDEWEFVPVLTGHEPRTPAWLWAQHNEHRLPLPRLVYLALFLASGDFRAGMVFQVALLSALSLGLMRYLRRLRGRAEWTDAFIPVGLLNWGHAENLLMGYQVNFALICTLVSLMLVAANESTGRTRHRPALVVGVLLLLLELCGASGLVFVVPVGVWFLWLSRREWAIGPGTAAAISAMAFTAFAYIPIYFAGYVRPAHHPTAELRHAGLVAVIAAEYLAMAFGLAAATVWPTVALGLLWLAAAAGRHLVRVRSWGVLAVLSGALLLAAAVGVGRAGFEDWQMGLWSRYGWLAWPVVFAGYLTFATDGSWFGGWVRRAVAIVTVAFLPFNLALGWGWGSSHDRALTALTADIEAGQTPEELVAKHLARSGQAERALRGLPMLRAAGVGPFGRLREETP